MQFMGQFPFGKATLRHPRAPVEKVVKLNFFAAFAALGPAA